MSCPGARLAEAAAGLGKGFGRGVAGNANRPLAEALLLSAFLRGAGLLSVLGAAFIASPSAPPLFCWAQSGKEKSALIANAAHKLRISFLPRSIKPRLFGSRARRLSTRCCRRTPLVAFRLCHSLVPSPQILPCTCRHGRT